MIHGEYGRREYHIYRNGHVIYTAGNHPHDSQFYLPPDEGVGLEEMRRFCEHTCQEIAAERGEPYGGVDITDDEEDRG